MNNERIQPSIPELSKSDCSPRSFGIPDKGLPHAFSDKGGQCVNGHGNTPGNFRSAADMKEALATPALAASRKMVAFDSPHICTSQNDQQVGEEVQIKDY